MYPPPRVKQALVTTISRPTAAEVDGEDELPRMLWVLAGAGGKTVLELVLLNLVSCLLCWSGVQWSCKVAAREEKSMA